MKPWPLAIIPCTSSKNPTATVARSLYRSTGFALMMQHAQQRAERILIMSAFYGLLELDSPVRYYDAYLPGLARGEREALMAKLRVQAEALPPQRILSYLPYAYHKALLEARPVLADLMVRPYALPMFAQFKLLKQEIAEGPK
jgi:hypothetical protein